MRIIKKKIFFINSQFSTNNNFNGINNLVTLYETTIMLNKDKEKNHQKLLGFVILMNLMLDWDYI